MATALMDRVGAVAVVVVMLVVVVMGMGEGEGGGVARVPTDSLGKTKNN